MWKTVHNFPNIALDFYIELFEPNSIYAKRKRMELISFDKPMNIFYKVSGKIFYP